MLRIKNNEKLCIHFLLACLESAYSLHEGCRRFDESSGGFWII